MLQNASLLAIVAVDTAENEPSEVSHAEAPGKDVKSARAQLGIELRNDSQCSSADPLYIFYRFCRFLEGSFSAVSTATIARNGAFFHIFRDLPAFHAFAPLRT
mgnify:CR=1 FL=1